MQAEPGAGKSTALPLSLLNADWLRGKKILMLEPRRVAAKSIAYYLAGQLGERVGQRIGYQVKNDRKISKETVLEIVTEGILTRRLQGDPELSDIGLIIFDEFHERSIHADLSLMLSIEIQQSIREDLKLLVMSATIDTRLIADYMGGADSSAEIIECPGRVFPVTVNYVPSADSRAPLTSHVVNVLRTVLTSNSGGDTLVFLPGQADIRRCLSAVQEAFGVESDIVFLPLYGALSISQQEQALIPDPEGRRRVVFTTNIAETSLTIEGVTSVIDSGLEKTLIFDPASCMTRLDTGYISKASSDQRKGRAGRTQPGTCYRLWSEEKQRTLKEYQGEEILTTDLTAPLLELYVWGAGDHEDINWLTAPPKAHFSSAKNTLISLGLIDEKCRVTPLGNKTAGIGLSPRLATMLMRSEGAVDKGIACELAALLSDRDIFYPNNGVDIAVRLLAFQDYKIDRKTALNAHPIIRSSAEQLLISANSLRRTVKSVDSKKAFSLHQLHCAIGRLLLYAYPDRLAKRRSSSCGRYLLANGRGVFLYEDDPLFGTDWLVIANCDAQKKEGKIFSAAAIDYENIRDCLGDKIEENDQFEFDRKKQKVTGRCVSSYGAIIIKAQELSEIPPDNFKACLFQVFQASGLDILNWTARCDEWLSRAQWLGDNFAAFPQLSKQSLINSLDEWLLPYLSNVNSISALRKVNLYELLLGTLSWEEQQFLNKEAPIEYKTPSGKSIPISYNGKQGPTVSVQLQEMFGELNSPGIAGGKVPLRFELLSPARRPIQTTSDLENFWKTSYFDVAKEMRGRYPKHRWPDHPLLEKPGRSIKRR